MVANGDDPRGKEFLDVSGQAEKISYKLADARPFALKNSGIDFTFEKQPMHSPLIGEFNLMNILAAVATAKQFDIPNSVVAHAIAKVSRVPGRVEFIDAGQSFQVVVDYAHTPESLKALFEAFPNQRKICVLGSTGGGRDTWNRPVKGAIADAYCAVAILTDEDPYDEDPRDIVEMIARGFSRHTPEIIMDRREAIRKGLSLAKAGDVVLIIGKGTDPYLMRTGGTKEPWGDATVAREEVKKL